MIHHLAKLLILLALWPTAAVAALEPPPVSRAVRVAAASDLKFALDEIVRELQAAEPGLSVQPTYGSSGSFFAQIQEGAPFDVFLAADVEYTHRLAADGFTAPGSEFVYGVGRVVLWVPQHSTLEISGGLTALRDPAVHKIAIANPRHAPYGRAAVAALEAAGLSLEVSPKLVLGENVAQAAQFVQSGAADAGIIALSWALSAPMAAAGRYWAIPASSHPRLTQGGVILKSARDPKAAARFRDFVTGPGGCAILKRHGFVIPGA